MKRQTSRRKAYPSDISREQFESIRADLEGHKKRTKPREHDLYEVFCGLLESEQGHRPGHLGLEQGHRLRDPAPSWLRYLALMSVRTDHQKDGGVFFCTFTCFRWLPMIDRVSMYEWMHDWFRRLHAEGERMVGYVIMPNHLHILLLVQEGHSINRILAEGKRFMSHEIRKRLLEGDDQDVLALFSVPIRTSKRRGGR